MPKDTKAPERRTSFARHQQSNCAISLGDIAAQLGGSRQFLTSVDIQNLSNAAAVTAFQDISASGIVQSSYDLFYDDDGFVGAIMKDGEKYIVVLRGSDAGITSTMSQLAAALLNSASFDAKSMDVIGIKI